MNSNQKGKRGEREFRDVLRAEGYDARRGQQFSGSPDSPDLVTSLPIHFEVKRTEKLKIRDAVVQAATDSAGKPWAVATKWNNGQWLIIQSAEHWFKAVRGDFSQTERDDRKSHSFACFKCGDGYTPLYCLNCARDSLHDKL